MLALLCAATKLMRTRFIPKICTFSWEPKDLGKLLWDTYASLKNFDASSVDATREGVRCLANLYVACIQLPSVSPRMQPTPGELKKSVQEIVNASFACSDSEGRAFALGRLVDGSCTDPEYV